MNNYKIPLASLASLVIGLSACGGGDSSAPTAEADAPASGKSALMSEGFITGFGSVIVDGLRFDTSAAVIKINDEDASEDQLEPGMEVRVFGEPDARDPNRARADRIEMRDRLRGPIESIDQAAQQFVVLETTVLVDEQTVFRGAEFAELTSGDQVAVSGLSQADGSVLARFVGKRDADDPAGSQIRGRIRNLDEDLLRFDLGRVSVDYSGAGLIESPDGLSDGDAVVVRGERDTSTDRPVFSAREVREIEIDTPPADRPVRVRGLIAEVLDGGVYRVRDLRLRVGPEAIFRQGSREQLVVGAELQALGRATDERRLIEVEQLAVLPALNAAVEAVVESVDRERRLVTVLGGLTIAIPDNSATAQTDASAADDSDTGAGDRDRRFSFADIEPATAIRALGHWDGQVLTARNVHRSRLAADRAFVGGQIEALNEAEQSLQMLGVTVLISDATRIGPEGDSASFFANAAVGDRLSAIGAWNGVALDAAVIRHGARPGPGRPGQRPSRVDRVDPARSNDEVDAEGR